MTDENAPSWLDGLLNASERYVEMMGIMEDKAEEICAVALDQNRDLTALATGLYISSLGHYSLNPPVGGNHTEFANIIRSCVSFAYYLGYKDGAKQGDLDLWKDNLTMNDNTTLVIGLGEIGRALYGVLSPHYKLWTTDIDDSRRAGGWELGPVDVMHVCFPYSDGFIEQVRGYAEKFKPDTIVIHSTVPPGTSSQCGAVHSPVIGVHPHLKESLLTFTKFIGGPEPRASMAARHLNRAGIKTYITDKARTTEVMKIMSTTFYALMIEYTKEVKSVCYENNIPFEMWTLWTNAYNKGYNELGRPEVTRPNLVPMEGKLGGHCLLPNLELLGGDFADLIKKRNE